MNYKQIREAAYEANVIIKESGLVVLTWGNASAADKSLDAFAVKPSGVDYGTLAPENMVVVRISTGAVIEGDYRPSSDTPTHRRLYEAYPSIGGIVHTHSTCATAFAQAGKAIPCYGTTHADHFAGDVPITRHPTVEEIESGYEAATGELIVEHFRNAEIDPLFVPAALLPHHGPFVWGRSASEAVENAIALEEIAGMAIRTRSLTESPPAIPERLREKHFSRKHGPRAYYGQGG